MARQPACVPQARPQEAGMLRAGLAVLIAKLSTLTTEQRVHGSTAHILAASATTGGRNASGKACLSHRQAKQVLYNNRACMARQPACAPQARPREAGMLQAGLAVLIANLHIIRLTSQSSSMARQPTCVPQARPQEAGMLQAGLAVLIAKYR